MEQVATVKTILQKVQEKVEAERNAQAQAQARKTKRNRIIFARRMVALSFLMIGLFTMVSFASDFTHDLFDEEKQNQRMEKEIAKYDQVEVVVPKGETAWTIQEKLTPGKDLRDMIYYAEYINERNSLGDIKAGETLIFLKTKDSK